MNLLLLEDGDFREDGTVQVGGRRAQHVRAVLKAGPGDLLRAGRLGGLCGHALICHATQEELILEPFLTEPPPPRAKVELLLAVPRPKALKKLLPALASLGVHRIVLLNAARVEKSYFESPVLSPDMTGALLRQGLEQAQDTLLPELLLRPRFRPFVEDELPALADNALGLIAHPTAATGLEEAARKRGAGQRTVLAVGPEGGWVPFELALLRAQGLVPVSLGPRTLRVEVVVPYLLGRLAG